MRTKELVLCRDALGIKPLVRCVIGDSLLFASEIKAFHAHDSYNPLDELSLALRLSWEYTMDSSTLIQGVHQVRQHHRGLRINGESAIPTRSKQF